MESRLTKVADITKVGISRINTRIVLTKDKTSSTGIVSLQVIRAILRGKDRIITVEITVQKKGVRQGIDNSTIDVKMPLLGSIMTLDLPETNDQVKTGVAAELVHLLKWVTKKASGTSLNSIAATTEAALLLPCKIATCSVVPTRAVTRIRLVRRLNQKLHQMVSNLRLRSKSRKKILQEVIQSGLKTFLKVLMPTNSRKPSKVMVRLLNLECL